MTAGDDGGFQPHPGDPWHPGYPTDEEQASDESEDSGAQDKRERRKDRKARKEKKSRRSRRGKSDLSEEALAAQAAFDPSSTAFDQADAIGDGEPIDDDPFGAVLDSEQAPRRSGSDDVPAPAWTVDEEPSTDQVLPVEQPSWVGQATEAGGAVESVEFEAEVPDRVESPEVVASDDELEPIGDPSDELADDGAVADVDVGDLLEIADEPQIAGEYGVAGPEAYDELGGQETGEIDDWDAFVQGEVPSELAESEPATFDEDPSLVVDPAPKKRRGLFKRRAEADEEDVIDDGFVGVAASDQPIDIPEVIPDAAIEERAVEASEALFGAPTEPLAGEEAFDEWVTDDTPKKRRGLFRRSRSQEPDADSYVDPQVEFGAQVESHLPTTDGFDDVPPVPIVAPPMSESFEPQDEVGAAFLPPEADPAEELDWTAEGVAEVEPIGSTDDAAVDEGSLTDVSLEDPDVAAAVAEALAALSGDEEQLEPSVELEAVVESVADAESDAEIAQPLVDTPLPAEDRDASEEMELPAADITEATDTPRAPEGVVAEAPEEPVVESDESTDWEGDAGRVPAAWFAEIDEDEVVPPPAADTPETEWPVQAAGGDLGQVDQPESGEADEADVADEPTDDWVTDGGELTGDAFNVESQAMPQQAVDHGAIAGDTDLFDVEAPEPAPQPQPAPPSIPDVPEGYEPWGAAVEGALGAGREDELDDATYEYEPMLQEGVAPADALPEGFEQFPGEMEPFQLTEDELAAEMGQREAGWVTDAVDSGSAEEPEFDETIYAGQGTIEHRDLAAAIEAAGDENTQWQAISAAMPGLETGVLGFEDVADLGSGGDYVAPVRSNLSTRVGTGLVLVTLLFGSLFLADIAFVVFIGAMLMLGLVEFFAALRRSGYLPLTLFGLIGGAATLVATWFHGPLALGSGVLLTTMMTFFFYAFSPTRRDALANGGLTVLGVGWIIGTVGFVIPIARAEEHVALVFAVVVITAATDIGAFAFGRTWGKRPLAPVLSPNKTAEGLVGGVLLALGAAAVFGFLEIGPFDVASALGLGVIIIVLAPLGDLAESMIKRSLGIKDMGSTLPGHGGVLDRIDAFLFVVPAAWAFYELVGYLG